ncbi:uncharacterized protein [Pyxicephalus adspersus]|uniref:uncharacterized protein n=1 Tax=Pyxicephalus adspersus TaxID=30357 RepID=UPI003B5CC7CB
MVDFLNRYPDRQAATVLREGFQVGFRIPCERVALTRVHKNLRSALQYPGVVTGKLRKEVALGRMAGPFRELPLRNLVISPLGVVPKKEPGQFRMIHHLSYPTGESVNDGIAPELCRVVYTSFDRAVALVRKAGKGCLMAKADVESAFRLLPVHPESFWLLGCCWEGAFYVDKCLPMGCSISCSLFEMFSSFLEWVVKEVSGVQSIIHYLDDFLCVGPSGSSVCANLLGTLEHVAGQFGVPLAGDKTVGPVTELAFLGILLDSVHMECRLPEDKLEALKGEVRRACCLEKIRLVELQSLLGKLNFACRIMPMGRIFSRRLAAATAGIKRPEHFVRLTKVLRQDLGVWRQFLEQYNGRSLWLEAQVDNEFLELWTDAAGSSGFGAYFAGHWCAEAWPEDWRRLGLCKNLILLELFPLVVALTLWGSQLQNRKVRFHCDNMGVVEVINNNSASSPQVICLLQHLVLVCLRLNVFVRAVHVPGCENVIADSLSRFQWDRFRELAPGADVQGTPCPEGLWSVIWGH